MINVKAHDGRTYYVDSVAGNDTNDGLSPDRAWKTADKVFSGLSTTTYKVGDTVLFKKGQTFSVLRSFKSTHFNNLLITSKDTYGSGDKPVIKYMGTSTDASMIIASVNFGSHDFAVTDLKFDLASDTVSPTLGYKPRMDGFFRANERVKNVLLMRIDAINHRATFAASGIENGNPLTTGFFLFDNYMSMEDYRGNGVTCTSGVLGVWAWMNQLAIVKNRFDKSWDHHAYLTHLNKAVIVGNDFSRHGNGRTSMRIIGALNNGVETNNIYIADNRFMGWRDPVGPYGCGNNPHQHSATTMRYNLTLLQLGPNNGTMRYIKDVAIERNVFTNAEVSVQLANTENVVVRNNIMTSPNTLSTNQMGIIQLGYPDWETRPNKNIKIIGNTLAFKNGQSANPAVAIWSFNTSRTGTTYGAQHENISFLNNIIYGTPDKSFYAIKLRRATSSLMSALNIDGNLYYVPASTDGKIFGVESGGVNTSYSLEGWRGLSYDKSSQSQVKPLFTLPVTITSYGVGEPLTLDENIKLADSYREMFKLSPNLTNSAIDKGLSLVSSLFYDFTGLERPNGSFRSSGLFDVGAYELSKDNKLPVASFSFAPATGTAPVLTKLDARASSDPEGNSLSYLWSFGDGGSAVGSTTEHVYITGGNYEVKLTVDDGAGGIASSTKVIFIATPDTTKPVTTVTPAGGTYTQPQTVKLQASEPAKIFACSGLACRIAEMGLSPVTMLIDVTKSLYYYAVDLAGNREATSTQNM